MIADVFFKTVSHFFPKLTKWLNQVADPRQVKKIKYRPSHLLWLGVFLFLARLGSKRQIKFRLATDEFKKNLNLLTYEDNHSIAHHDTLENFVEKLNPDEMSLVRHKMIARLLRMKCLSPYRLMDIYYMIAVDGTGHLAFSHRHCPYCLTKEKDGKVIYYYHNVLEAKIVTEAGLALSCETEFIENNGLDAKQDCELKAFYRMLKRLKKKFPQLKICILLDSLYAADPVIELIEGYGWKYIITFKEGSMPDTYAEFENLKNLCSKNNALVEDENVIKHFRWVNNINYRSFPFDVLELKEFNSSSDKKYTKFVWLTNISINSSNFNIIAKGGRLRWKIENEGFNIQKNRGYNLEHPYSQNEISMKNFYLLLQIAHILSQLIEKGSLLKDKIEKVFGSITNIFHQLLEDLRTKFIGLDIVNFKPIQIRLASPP